MPIMDKLEEIKDKLRKLIAKEESARELGNQAEAEAFASKVQQLLLQYELDLGDIKSQTAETIEIKEERFTVYNKSKLVLYIISNPSAGYKIIDLTVKNESNWIRDLYGIVALTNFCKILAHAKDPYVVILIGTDMNREFVHYMVLQLVSKMRNLARKSYSTYKGTDKRNTFIRSFLRGCNEGISTRLMLDRLAADRDKPQVHALIVQKDRMVNDYLSKTYGNKLGKGRANSKLSSQDGFNRGMETGRTINAKTEIRTGGTKLLGT